MYPEKFCPYIVESFDVEDLLRLVNCPLADVVARMKALYKLYRLGETVVFFGRGLQCYIALIDDDDLADKGIVRFNNIVVWRPAESNGVIFRLATADEVREYCKKPL